MKKYNNILYFLNYVNPIFYTKEYLKKKKFMNSDFNNTNNTKSTTDFTKKSSIDGEKAEFKLKEKTLNERKESLEYYKQIKNDIRSDLSGEIQKIIAHYGYYSHDAINDIIVNLKGFNDKKIINNQLTKKQNSFLNMKRWNERNKLNSKPYSFKIKYLNKHNIRLNAYKHYAKVHNIDFSTVKTSNDKKTLDDIINTYVNIIALKRQINYKKQEAIIKKRNFLAKVLRVLLYVEDVEAEHLNEKLAKSFFYTRDVDYNFRVRSSNVKVRSLEWTISSPPPLHTFYVPVRTIVTNDRFYNYKKGKRLLQNINYNFKEMPSIYVKGYRKVAKLYYLARNYVYYVLNLKDYSKDDNLWYKGSHYVENSNDYSHTVEYVSQSVRYPYKHLSKHLPFSAGLHKNTISIDLLITPDKSNKTIFGENKSLLHKKKYLNLNNNFIKPLFVVGDRTNELIEVNVLWLEKNYKNYLNTISQIRNELHHKGDGFFTAYYLPAIKKNTFFFYLWEMATIESPRWNNFFYETITTTSKPTVFKTDKFQKYDDIVLDYDIQNKWFKKFDWVPSKISVYLISSLQKLEHLRQKNKYVKFFTRDLFDIQDFNHSARFIYSYFYAPYVVSKKMKSKFFYSYLLRELIGKPLLAIGWVKFVIADTHITPNWIRQIKKFFKIN